MGSDPRALRASAAKTVIDTLTGEETPCILEFHALESQLFMVMIRTRNR